MELLGKAKDICKTHHDARELCMRYGAVTTAGAQTNKYSSGCFGSLTHLFPSDKDKAHPFVYVPYHGDGCALSFEALVDLKKYNEEMAAYPRDWNAFEGNDRSMIWTQFLLSDHSPWQALLPMLAEKDPEYCNTAGFIFQDIGTMPAKLFYNFTMAIRLPWEMSKVYAHWLLLRDKMDDRLALYVASNFELRATVPEKPDQPAVIGATTLEDGPWDIIYPWSYLESTTLEAAGRFIRCNPATVKADEQLSSPNVAALWTTEEDTAKAWEIAGALSENNSLTLSQIVETVNECVSRQAKLWK